MGVFLANLRGANLTGANFTKATLSGACLVNANLTDAITANSTNLANAIFCNTTMPDGFVNDSGRQHGTPCCPAGTSYTQCPAPQRCVDGVCRGCDVCASGFAHTSVQAASDAAAAGDTSVICAGTYPTNAEITKDLTLVGAGTGNPE